MIPAFIRRDFARKLIALALALIVYFVVAEKIGVEREIQGVAVNLIIPDSLVELEDKPQLVSLLVQGSDRSLKRLTDNDFSVTVKIDESKFVPKTAYNLSIEPKDVKAPFGVTVSSVKPSTLRIDLDRVMSKTVSLRAAFDSNSKLPEGYAVGKIVLSPSDVRVTGPSSVVERIESLQTRPIPLSSITQSFEYSAEVANAGSNLKISPSKALVQVEVIKESEARLFKNVPIRILRSSGFKRLSVEMLSAPNAEIAVVGPRSQIELMRDEEVKPFIDISQFEQPGIYNVNVNCWLERENVDVRNIHPQSVRIKLIDAGDLR
jgi:YbbR domain-containing protein